MESKAGKKKRSSSSRSCSYSPALSAVIEDLRPWGCRAKWKDPALGDVRPGHVSCYPCPSPAVARLQK